MSRRSFYISKWYFDVVDDLGRTFIGYTAQLKWRGMGIPYSSLLFYEGTSPAHFKSHFGNVKVLADDGQQLHWEAPYLGARGNWERLEPPITACLFEHPNGQLDWRCHYPRAKASVALKEGETIRGLGYAEELHLSVEPWNIPMETLRWGRYTGNQMSLVWIELGGKQPRQWVFLDGQAMPPALIDDHRIMLPEASITLELNDRAILEREPKILNVARSISRLLPGFRKAIPSYFLHAKETKWRSRGKIVKDGVPLDTGWAVHELLDLRDTDIRSVVTNQRHFKVPK